ncbi:MAG: winged helix-turn-helix domain-containing protein [Methanomassiliicoccus sp.]|nr:winged helix-turn-helix domain-containing protein [Methanomassiliicoccus sp.]
MSTPVKPLSTRETRLKIYAHLAEGKCQASVAKLLDLKRSTVSEHAKALEEGNFIKRIPGKEKPVLYEKGPRGPELDILYVRSSEQINARGVTQCSENLAKVPTANVHHLKFRLNVVKEGDTQFIYKRGRRYRNIERSWGQVPYQNKFVTVELEQSFAPGGLTTLYIYPPEMDLTADELPRYEEIAALACMEISGFMQKNMGWKLGIPELTDWQRHIGIDNPALMKGVAEKYFMKSKDGKVWTSNSGGRSEEETDSIEHAQILLDLPGEVLTIKTTMVDLVEDLKLIVEALSLSKDGMERVAVINGIELKAKAKEALDKLQGSVEGSKAAAPDRNINDPGVMFG